MQQTSTLYQRLLLQPGTHKEVRVMIAGTVYNQGQIISLSTSANLFAENTMSVGGAVAKEINLILWPLDDIPRTAQIIPAYRLVNGGQQSEWIQKGIFWIDTRTTDKSTGVLTIHGYDAMLRAEQVWTPDQSLSFPMTMKDAVEEISRLMRISIDPRSVLSTAYTIDYPANNYTLRDVLRYIAAAHAGNFMISDLGQLRLVTYEELPLKTHYLVDERGNAILFGGVRVLV